jgi:REP element-mobilizing transposase RayT
VVLRSSLARGAWSFRAGRNHDRVAAALARLAAKHGVELCRRVIHLNHLHLLVRVPSRKAYTRFIRAASSAVAMAVTRASRWKPRRLRFWDRRPFTRVVVGKRDEEGIRDYFLVNELETLGYARVAARFRVAWEKGLRLDRELRRKRQARP